MKLDEDAAKEVLSELAADLDVGLVELANGIIEIVATNMVGGIRVVSVEKGYDPRDFALTCYGGAGPMFADRLARKIGVGTAIIPAVCGVLSAFGLISANKRFDFATSQPLLLNPNRLEEINEIYADLEARAQQIAPDASLSRTANIRYHGQTFNLKVELPSGQIDQTALTEIRSRFEAKYESIYGETNPTEDLEVITWRLDAISDIPPVEPHFGSETAAIDDAIKSTRMAYSYGKHREHTVYDRYMLPMEQPIDGPAIIEEDESTTVIGPGSTFKLDTVGNLVIDVDDG